MKPPPIEQTFIVNNDKRSGAVPRENDDIDGAVQDPLTDIEMSRPDPARFVMMPDESVNPTVGYTVKELVARVEAKLDAYALQQFKMGSTLERIVPIVEDNTKRLEKLELIQLGRDAVKTWHSTMWRVVYGFAGALASFAITYGAFHH